MRRYVIVISLLTSFLLTLPMATAKSQEIQWADDAGPGSIRLTLTTNRSSCKVGGDIEVHVVPTNVSSSTVKILGVGSIAELEMVVTDARGRVVPENTGRTGTGRFSGYHYVAPGSDFIETNGTNRFQPLSDFGYELKNPRTYHIVARLRDSQVTSNPVTITLTK